MSYLMVGVVSRYWSLIMYMLCLFSSWQLLRLEWPTTSETLLWMFGNMIHVHYGWYIRVNILLWPQYLIHLTVINLEFMGYPSYNLWNADKNDTKLVWIIAINNQISIFIWFDWLKSHMYNVCNTHIYYINPALDGLIHEWLNNLLLSLNPNWTIAIVSRCYRVMIMA